MISLAQLGSRSPEQGTDEWLDQRKGRITGSKPAGLIFDLLSGRDSTPTEGDWTRIWEEWFAGRKAPPFSEDAIARMQYGSVTEDVAAMALVKAIPGAIFFERPLIEINKILAASPDGYIVQFAVNDDGSFKKPLQPLKYYNLEIKCPLFELRDNARECIEKMKKKKLMQYYYVGQIHFEMMANNVRETLFINYTKHRSHIWKVKWDEEIWRHTLAVVTAFKDRACSFQHLQGLLSDWKMACMKYAAEYPIWKIIDEEGNVINCC